MAHPVAADLLAFTGAPRRASSVESLRLAVVTHADRGDHRLDLSWLVCAAGDFVGPDANASGCPQLGVATYA